jgi:tRNA pseudouridine38-40 synthase
MMEKRRLAMRVAYHGGDFSGFQRQPSQPSVQGALESAWRGVSGEEVVVHGSGRTDSGVHSYGQVIHFDTHSNLEIGQVGQAINAHLPNSVSVRGVCQAPADFHSRFHAIGKRYVYLLATGPHKPVLRAGLVAWDRCHYLRLEQMRSAAQYLVGEKDFGSFAGAGKSTKTSVRTMTSIHLKPMRGGIMFCFQANGFLFRMARIMVGTLLEVGKGRRAPEWVEAVLGEKDRTKAGPTAAAEGLYLWKSLYPPGLLSFP